MGAIAGTLATTISYPADLIRKRIIVQEMGGKEGTYGGISDAVRKVPRSRPLRGLLVHLKLSPREGLTGGYYVHSSLVRQIMREEGPKGFYRGLTATYLKVVPSTAVTWWVIELCRSLSTNP
jgi:solute carrier family 25 phosphate transporter 23/24/25/41